MAIKLILLCTINVLFIIASNGERTKDKMYERIEATAACFRRLNATHQTGCTSKRPSSVGVIHMITDIGKDLNFVLKEGQAPPYVAVLPIDQFSKDLIAKLSKHTDRIAGVVVHTNITRPKHMSHEISCPNSLSSLQNSCPNDKPWNPLGTGLLHADIPFPVFVISNETELIKLQECFTKWNSWSISEQPSRSLCSLELASFMFATRDSRTCLRRSNSVTTFTPTKFCDPLGSRNAWATLWPRNNGTDKLDVVLVTARMDTTSMFYDVTPGADSHLTGLVTLLATAYTLKKMVNDSDDYKKNIMFVLFNGEAYDYIGSQRFVYDILEHPDEAFDNIIKLAIGNIKLIVELNQLNPNPQNEIFIHHIEPPNSEKDIDDFISSFTKEGENFSLKINNVTANKNTLPPASLHSFLRERSNIRGVVLTDHQFEYKNRYYHSSYDDAENIDYHYYNSTEGGEIPEDSLQKRVMNMSSALARTLYQEAMGKPFTGKLDMELDVETIVDELFHCFLDTAYCKFFQALTGKDRLSESPLSSYVSVDTNNNKLTSLVGFTLAWLTSDHVNNTQETCTADADHPTPYQYFWVLGNLTDPDSSTCLRTTMHFSLALSPAFTIDNYDWTSNKYSSWTESIWSEVYMRMFLVPSHKHEVMTISVGTVTFVLSIALVYFVHSRADILFAKPDAVTPGTSC